MQFSENISQKKQQQQQQLDAGNTLVQTFAWISYPCTKLPVFYTAFSKKCILSDDNTIGFIRGMALLIVANINKRQPNGFSKLSMYYLSVASNHWGE